MLLYLFKVTKALVSDSKYTQIDPISVFPIGVVCDESVYLYCFKAGFADKTKVQWFAFESCLMWSTCVKVNAVKMISMGREKSITFNLMKCSYWSITCDYRAQRKS